MNRVRLGGIKFWLDGSIPTAWMSQPYARAPRGERPGYRAYPQIPDAVLKLWGAERAAHAMAAGSMVRAGIPFTFSHDAPVSPQPWVLALVDSAWQIKEGRTFDRRGNHRVALQSGSALTAAARQTLALLVQASR